MVRKSFLGLFILLAAVLLTGCEKKTPGLPAGAVKANPAYLENFGQPPTPESGTCFARVGFFPLRSDPGKVRPVPFFLFREDGQLQLVLARLVSGEVTFPEESDLFNPFPAGTRLKVGSLEQGVAELTLSLDGNSTAAPDLAAMAAALTETAVQFNEVKRVRILVDGVFPPGMPDGGFGHEPQRIASPDVPNLLMVIGNWEQGAEEPEEILANFDRPVTIGSFRLQNAGGQEVKGKYYQSAFDMAVVIHPENPSAYREGVSLSAAWDVIDALGRQGKGEAIFRLQRHEHPAEKKE
ncbi:MAG TPA: GerMN domain-containing protein [Desulfuromonadales bacterium]|nr:GerMN domain-containing protein [Desulfuromonadales bacterium]